MKKYLNGKVVIVTGASSGIGEAMAREYAKMGAKVVMAARREDELQRITTEIIAQGGEVVYSVCDVVSEEDCKRLINRAVEAFGGIDILICNAGLSMRALFDDCDLKVLHRLMDVNFWGTVNCTKYALPWIQKSKGSIVGILLAFAMGYLILRGASRLDAFSVYPVQTWLLCHAVGTTTDPPEVRPSRSSRTKDSSSQISYARAG